jgi:hypothetical protein
MTSPLRQALESETGTSLKDLTVLATQNDPFRVDTPARHRDGEWLAITARELGLGNRRIHLRGLHYMVLGRPKPDGTPYTNTEADWLWLSGDAGKAARWLGYIPFDQIVDQRNAAPVVRRFVWPLHEPHISTEVDVYIPDAEDIEPSVGSHYFDAEGRRQPGFEGVQPYKLVMVGEKSSLDDVLAPIAQRYHADLYLPTGEISDTLIYQMATTGKVDGRPMVVFYFADCDPAGWQMGVCVARKLQAFQALDVGPAEWELHRVALTPDQVREYDLPSTPLKDTEKRGDKWRAAWGVQQTEIDALAALRPDLLRRIAREALDPFFDWTLDQRVMEAYSEWEARAQSALDNALDADRLEQIRVEAARRLGELQEQIDAINEALYLDPGDVELPPIVVPGAELNGAVHPLPLLDSRWSFAEQCRALIDSKAYGNGGTE